ncbi:MAG: trypsin-like peptidase domain-containing protein [Chthoniobacteraceae bacterium]|nr:trypsin-like peptidase domain-containing protein [Chthoniobacteraceae bacterium]
MKRFLLFVLLVALALLAVSRWNQRRRAPVSFTPATAGQLHIGETPSLAALDDETTRLVQAVVPSVVSITTSRKVAAPQVIDPFELFFGRRAAPRETVKNSLGSGVIVSQEGHILTNYHVVANVDEVLVQLSDGRAPVPARFIGGDETTDIAVIQIDAKGVRPLPVGDSDTVKVGQLVFAIGNPFGLQETVTKGIISATGRVADAYGPEYFQTEAVINPGNSGGPLINIKGEVIGINTAIGNYSGSGTWQGVGFAIPSNTARRSLEKILKGGQAAAPSYLGVLIAPLTPELAEQAGIPGQTGAVVQLVYAGSPAQKAGVQPGDILLAFNGKPIKDPRDLTRQVAAVSVGSTVEIKGLRAGKEQAFRVTLENRPATLQPNAGTPAPQPSPVPSAPGRLAPGNPLAGVSVTEIPAGQRAAYPGNVQGVYVAAVDGQTAAARVLQPGDVIEQINGQPVPTPEAFRQLAAGIPPGKAVLLSLARGKIRSFAVIQKAE